MANKIDLKGFRELRDELGTLPTDLRDQTAPLMLQHARRAQAAVQTSYPVVTGALRAGVRILARVPRGIAAFYQLVSTAPHAHIYEFGSVRTRPHPVFLPIQDRERRASVITAATVVEKTGLQVRGQRD